MESGRSTSSITSLVRDDAREQARVRHPAARRVSWCATIHLVVLVVCPPVLPPAVIVRATEFDEHAQFPGIELPPELAPAVPKRRAEFLAGRWCAREAIRAHGLPVPVAIPIGAHREPMWPEALCGAITHAHGWAAAAVARRRDFMGIGLDCEVTMSAHTAANVRESIVLPGELAVARGATPNDQVALTLVFSAKETLFKCLYPLVARFFDYLDARIVELDAAAARFTIRLEVPLGEAFPAGATFAGQFFLAAGRVYTGLALPAPA
jgi:enterobactin synthetase component D